MKLLAPAFLALIFAGCGPNVGDVYEVVRTGEQRRIDQIGTCYQMRQANQSVFDSLIDSTQTEGQRRFMLSITPLPVAHYDQADSLSTCYGYAKQRFMPRFDVTVNLLSIQPIDELEGNRVRRVK